MKRARFSLYTGLLAAVLLSGTVAPGGLRAQWSELTAPRTVTEEEPANFFASWESDRPVDGFYVRTPEGWQLNRVGIAEIMGGSLLETAIRPSDSGRGSTYRVTPDSRLDGSYQAVFQIQVGDRLGTLTWEVTPYVETDDGDSLLTEQRYSRQVEVERALLFQEQYAVTFDPGVAERPGLADDSGPVSISLDDSFTAEFWMKTVHMNQVVVSTWDGRERSAYALEVMVGPRGYLNFYRGVGGMHHSLTSARPLADGTWHHVAVTHDNAGGWTRLIVDGQTVDSLHVDGKSTSEAPADFVVGGRPPSRYAAGDGDSGKLHYTGALDELRVWQQPRREGEVRRNMHRQIEGERDGLVRVGFDESDIDRRFTNETHGLQFVVSELSLLDPIEQLRAERRSTGVEVLWEAVPSYSEAFVVERSTDGRYFERVSQVPAGSSDGEARRRSRQYSLTDPTVHEGVVYYRVRQVVSEEERQPMAKTIKVGLRSPRKNTADLVGNFPNPFNAATVIKYELYEAQHVQLEVWDLSGHRRASLVNKTQEPGQYDVRFEAVNLPSGAYVIRLDTERATQTHTMILMK